jgi:lipoprotein-anchoring transpeptidase ErfK/SrfK
MNNQTQVTPQTQIQKRIPRPIRPRKTTKRWLPLAIAGGMTMLGFVVTLGLLALLGMVYFTQNRIPTGVSVAGLEVGGKSLDAAAQLIEENSVNQTITATDGERQWTLRLSDLGVSVDGEATAQAAQEARSGEDVPQEYSIDLNQAQNGLVTLSQQVNIAALPGNPPQDGRAMEIPVTLDRLRLNPTAELADGVLELDMIVVEAPNLEPGENYEGEPASHVVEAGQELALIAREYGVTVDDIVQMNGISNPDLLYVGQELKIPAAGRYEPTAEDAPKPPTNSGKAIVVSTQEQRIYAYENGQLVRSHLTSTGRSETPTVLGDYSVYVKYVADDMSGPGYFLPQVPYTMYFYQGYGIHGTYWHNSFGRPMSHGCVNLPTDEAEWFFNWAEVGTPVRVV